MSPNLCKLVPSSYRVCESKNWSLVERSHRTTCKVLCSFQMKIQLNLMTYSTLSKNSTTWSYLSLARFILMFSHFFCENISTFCMSRKGRINQLTNKLSRGVAKFSSRVNRLYGSTLHQLVLVSRFPMFFTNSHQFCDTTWKCL